MAILLWVSENTDRMIYYCPLGAMVLSASLWVIERRVVLLGRSDAFRSSVAFRTRRTDHPPQLHRSKLYTDLLLLLLLNL